MGSPALRKIAAGSRDGPMEQMTKQTTPEKTAQVPEFDIFRVEPDGSMVIAGRAVSGQTVDVILAGKAIDRVVADDGGYFVSLPIAGPAAFAGWRIDSPGVAMRQKRPTQPRIP